MYLRVNKFAQIFSFFEETVNSVGGQRLVYGDYRKIRAIIARSGCSECGERFNDGDGDILLSLNDKSKKYEIQCATCGGRIIVESDYLNDLLLAQYEGKRLESVKTRYLENNQKVTIDKIEELRNEINNNSKVEKENDGMLNGNKMFRGFDFGAVKGDAGVRVSHLGLAIKNADGVFVALDKNSQELTDVDFFDIDLDGMIYKMPVAHKDVKAGDVIVHNKTPMIVKEAGNNPKVIDPIAGEIKEIMPTKNMFGFNFFTKIVSLMDFSGADANAENPFGNLMPLMFMSNDKKDGKNNMMPMMMMAMMQGGDMSNIMSNPMMMIAMMGGDSNMSDMLPMMMMMGNNPFAQAQKKEVPALTGEVDN